MWTGYCKPGRFDGPAAWGVSGVLAAGFV